MLETCRALPGAKYRALLTIVPPHPSREGEIMQGELRQAGIEVFDAMIRRTVGFPKSALAGTTVETLDDPRQKAAWGDFESLGQEILALLESE